MTRRKPKPALPARDLSHLVTDLARAGEYVGIKGEAGVYKLLAEVLNTANGAEWVELIGGPSGHKQFRAVRPDRIRRATKRQVAASRTAQVEVAA